MGRRAPQSDPASDSLYGVVSVLYHALQGNDTSQQYGRDAQSEGDGELAQFFDECREQYDMLATRAKRILAGRLEGEAERGVISDEDEDEDEDEEASQDEG